MLIPPASYPGWKVWTVGDDIAWLHPGKDGRLYAINPESGYFGVVPGTNAKTNRNAYEMIRKDTIFTNVGLTADNQPWWEGLTEGKPVTDWQGRPYDPKNGPAAQPNSRFTVSAKQNPSYSKLADAPGGVPISAIVFGGRRRALAPLVYQARNWLHGVLIGAGVASETTAAATDAIGVVRRDPMAMKPFAGYNFGDYWAHWINVGAKLKSPPQIFHVNWFRQDSAGKYLMAGFRRKSARVALDHRSLQRQSRRTRNGHWPFARCCGFGSAGVGSHPGRARGIVGRATCRSGKRNSPGSNSICAASASACRLRSRLNYKARCSAFIPRRYSESPEKNCYRAPCRARSSPRREFASNRGARTLLRRLCRERTCHSCFDRSA